RRPEPRRGQAGIFRLTDDGPPADPHQRPAPRWPLRPHRPRPVDQLRHHAHRAPGARRPHHSRPLLPPPAPPPPPHPPPPVPSPLSAGVGRRREPSRPPPGGALVVPALLAFGWLMQRLVLARPLARGVLPPPIVLFGISMVLQNAPLLVAPADARTLHTPLA